MKLHTASLDEDGHAFTVTVDAPTETEPTAFAKALNIAVGLAAGLYEEDDLDDLEDELVETTGDVSSGSASYHDGRGYAWTLAWQPANFEVAA